MTPEQHSESESAIDQDGGASEPLVGRTFAYRARAIDELTPVLVLKEGTKKPARVLVQFVDPGMEGREDWVPPGRLKVLWDGVDAFRADEARWSAVHALAPRGSSPEEEAAEEVAELLIPEEVGVLWRGYLRVDDVKALAEIAGTDEAFVGSHPQGFTTDESSLIVPWPLALEIVKKALLLDPDPILSRVMQEEAKARYEAIHGHHFRTTRGSGGFLPPEDCAEYDADSPYGAPKRALLREWAGKRSDRWDELIELRKEIKRVGDVAEAAIAALRAHGQAAAAERLETELGMTVEMLRHSED